MAGTSNVNIGIGSGGVGTTVTSLSIVANLDQQAATIYDAELFNANSPAVVQLLNLSNGANTINSTVCPALPQSGGCFLIPPDGNTSSITLKGASGDTGVALNLTAPSFIAFTAIPPTSFVLTTAGGVTGFRIAFV